MNSKEFARRSEENGLYLIGTCCGGPPTLAEVSTNSTNLRKAAKCHHMSGEQSRAGRREAFSRRFFLVPKDSQSSSAKDVIERHLTEPLSEATEPASQLHSWR
jgi:hypothetical protein